MIRRIIHINEEKCNGCGACADACHESAIGMVNGKAKLLRDYYCDGLGAANTAQSVPQSNEAKKAHIAHGCPGQRIAQFNRQNTADSASDNETASTPAAITSQLSQWPVQIKLAPVTAPYFNGAKLLIAADCTAYAYANFHQDFIKGKITLVGCPKLDAVDYSEKLTEIIATNDIKSVTIVRMEVPCCGGLEHAAVTALKNSGKFIPWQVVTISIDGKILD